MARTSASLAPRRKNLSVEENKALVHRYVELINAADTSAFDEVLGANVVDRNPDPGQSPGIQGIREYFEMLLRAFADHRLTVEDVVAAEDKVAVRVTFRGTHVGELKSIPATGREVAITAMDIFRIERGKIVELWSETDLLGLMRQLGVVAEPE